MYKYFIRFLLALALLAPVLVCCSEKPVIEDPLKNRSTKVYGKLSYDDGKPAVGVTVSDGRKCVTTNSKGEYSFERSKGARYVYYTIPADAEVVTGGSYGLPVFYKLLRSGVCEYNFELKRQAVEKEFRLLTIGDPQVGSTVQIKRFINETVADIRNYVASKNGDMNSYAVTMGDIVNNKWELYPEMLPTMSRNKTGIPVFQCMGNHDHEFPKDGDELAVQTWESHVGPSNYAFNRSDVHIVVMDNIRHTGSASSVYDTGFWDWQYEWLKQELSNVSRDKYLVLVVHCPFREKFSSSNFGGDGHYQDIINLLGEFREARICSGHTHYIRNSITFEVNGHKVYDNNLGAACGGWWHSTLCTDASPNGYGVFEFAGNRVKNHLYKATNYDEGFQMRIYKGSEFKDFTSSFGQSYSWGYATVAGRAFVNVFNANASWEFEVYENGVKTGTLSQGSKTYLDMFGPYSLYIMQSVSKDYTSKTWHLYYYNIKDEANLEEIKVVARDGFGNEFTQVGFTAPNDYSGVRYP